MKDANVRIPIGHYASPSFDSPHKGQATLPVPFGPPLLVESYLELTDTRQPRGKGGAQLAAVLERYFPLPLRLTQRWSKPFKGQRRLYAWEALPPEGFVALGMLCSTSEEAPPLESIRCVPLEWCKLASAPPEFLWDDSGSSGTPGSIWVINKLRLIAVIPGHDPPPGPFYELRHDHLFLGDVVAAGSSIASSTC